MKLYLFSISLLFVFSIELLSQDIPIVRLDRSVLSGVGLKKIDLKDEPEKDFYQKKLFGGEDISVYVVGTETWTNEFKNFWFDEFIYMFHGQALVRPESSMGQVFNSGDYFFASKGFTGQWIINGGDHLHYELSVITTQRADSTKVSKNLLHEKFSRDKLSGTHIQLNDNDKYREVLRKGVELTVSLCAEAPMEYTVSSAHKDQLIQVLSGQISTTDSKGDQHLFYSGDWFVLPKGVQYDWKSEGHGLVKYLTVEKSD